VEPTVGSTIAGRYRVERRAWDAGAGAVWQAFDTVLERPVFVQTFPGADPEDVARAVARTAQINHPGVCRIYDMGSDPPSIVFEHAPAARLAERTDGALPVPRAAAVVTQLAGAIAALHERGVAHGSIGPDTVLFDEEGRPKLAGAGLREELGERSVAQAPAAYRPAGDDPAADEQDRYALGAIAYRLFTGREPGPDAPPARTVRRGLPPHVDQLLSRALARDAAIRPRLDEFRRALDPIASIEPPERGPGFFRQEARWLVPVIVVIAVAVAAIVIGVRTGAIHFGAKSTSRPRANAGTSPYRVLSVQDFDPPPGNGEEHPREAPLVVDGKDTSWSTVGYSRPNLDGRKKGVGLLFDLGDAGPVGRIEVRTPIPGWKAEWRRADEKGTRFTDYALVQEFTASGDPVMFSQPVRARYWLLWITRLVDTGSGGNIPYQAQVSEVAFYAS
jgi:hypothetical protein